MYKTPEGASTGKKKELKYSKKQLLRCEGKSYSIDFSAKLRTFSMGTHKFSTENSLNYQTFMPLQQPTEYSLCCIYIGAKAISLRMDKWYF